jgi:glycosyltransferase involved in cell wall biosynthesis
MSITVLTCTGNRKICLELLAKWIENQTLQPDQWLIIDDGEEPFAPNMDCDYIYRKPMVSDPEYTLNVNLKTAIPFITGDIIIFCEDDEYYAPDYIKTIVEKMKKHDAVGICKSKYYHLPSRTYYVHGNYDHASLAQTAISKKYLEVFEKLLIGDSFIDIRLWNDIKGQRVLKGKIPYCQQGIEVGNGRGFLFDD